MEKFAWGFGIREKSAARIGVDAEGLPRPGKWDGGGAQGNDEEGRDTRTTGKWDGGAAQGGDEVEGRERGRRTMCSTEPDIGAR